MSSKKDYDNLDSEENKANERSSLLNGKPQPRRKSSSNFSSSNGFNKKKRSSTSMGNTTSGGVNENQYLYVNQLLTVINDRRSRFQQNFSLVILLIVNVLERFAYYGLLCNYILYLNKQPFYWESFNASLILFIFLGITNISGVLGGWVADSFIGKYLTICISFFIYILGYAVFPILSISPTSLPGICNANSSTINWSPILVNTTLSSYAQTDRSLFDEACSWIIVIASFMVGIAVGFVKANLGPFGADQVISRGQTLVFKYFNWLYWCINLGSLASFSLLAYIQQNYNFFIGYLIPFMALILSFLLFLIGTFSYIRKEAEFPVLSTIFKVVYEAFKSKKRRKNLVKQKQRERALLVDDENSNASDFESSFNFDRQQGGNRFDSNSYNKISWLDNAKIRYGGRFDDNQVDDIKSLKRIIILFAILVPYWLVYFQIETTYLIQGFHMKLFSKSGRHTFMIPAAWLSIIDQITVLLLIPLMDSFVYPLMRKKFSSIISESTRLVFGMSLSALSIIIAGILESVRLSVIRSGPTHILAQTIGNTTYYAADLNILWQIPQYALIGLGEVFCSVSCLYFAYSAAPKSMQSIIMGLFYFFSGLGSFFGSLVLIAFKSFIFSSDINVDDINCPTCHLNYYFYTIGVIQLVGIIVFIVVNYKCSITRAKQSSMTNLNKYVYDENNESNGDSNNNNNADISNINNVSDSANYNSIKARTGSILNTNKVVFNSSSSLVDS